MSLLFDLSFVICTCTVSLQVLWELKAIEVFWTTLGCSLLQQVLQIVWVVLLLLKQPLSWLLLHCSMSMVAVMQVPMALLDASGLHEVPPGPPAARAIQWKRRWAHALLLWVVRCSVSYGLASLAW